MSRALLLRVGLSVLWAIALALIAGWLLGPLGYAVGSAMGLLVIAARHGNQVGACLPLAFTFLIIIGVILCLFLLLMLAPRRDPPLRAVRGHPAA